MHTVKISPFIAFELSCSNEGLNPSDGELYTAQLPLLEAQFAPGTYKVNDVALREFKSWADYGLYCAKDNWGTPEIGRISGFRAFLKQTTALVAKLEARRAEEQTIANILDSITA